MSDKIKVFKEILRETKGVKKERSKSFYDFQGKRRIYYQSANVSISDLLTWRKKGYSKGMFSLLETKSKGHTDAVSKDGDTKAST